MDERIQGLVDPFPVYTFGSLTYIGFIMPKLSNLFNIPAYGFKSWELTILVFLLILSFHTLVVSYPDDMGKTNGN